MAERFSCSRSSQDREEPRYGTASQVRRWILVEQPGPWGPDAVLDSRLPLEVGAALRAHGRRVGARVLLIRRHGRYEPVGRTCLVVTSGREHRRVERLQLGAAEDLLDVDWRPLGEDEPIGGELVHEPLFLVCTNGRHDPCCAERGRPLAHALTAAFSDQVWESSHFGGDRFAGNLVCLPHGLYYGGVEAVDGPRLASLYIDGALDLGHYRGMSDQPFVVQAAEYFARKRTGLVGLDDLAVEGVRDRGGRVAVSFRAPDGADVAVEVAVVPEAKPRRLTCHAGTLHTPPRYVEVDAGQHPPNPASASGGRQPGRPGRE